MTEHQTVRARFAITHRIWSGPRRARRRSSISPAATSSRARSTICRARATPSRLSGANDTGYAPLMEAIAARYGDSRDRVTTAQRHVRRELPGVRGAARAGRRRAGRAAGIRSAARRGPDVRRANAALRADVRGPASRSIPAASLPALTPRTRLIVITHPHNPTGVAADRSALDEIGRIARTRGRARPRRRGLPRRRSADGRSAGSRTPTTCSSRPAA